MRAKYAEGLGTERDAGPITPLEVLRYNTKMKTFPSEEARKAWDRERHRNHPEYRRSPEAIANANRSIHHIYGALKYIAKHRGLDFNISFNEFQVLRSRLCFYCGGPLSEASASIDRINNELGYVTGNVRPCCHPCNQAKSNFSEATFKDWAVRLYHHYVLGASNG